MRAKSFRIRRSAAVAATAVLAIAGVGLLAGGIANASTDTGVTNLSAFTVNPVTVPSIFTGGTNQTASSITFTLPNDFTALDTISFTVGPHATTNCAGPATEYIGFASTPTAVAVMNGGSDHTDTTPTFGAALSTVSANPGCASIKDTLTLTINQTSTGTAGDSYAVTVSGIQYNVGATADLGTISDLVTTVTATGGPITTHYGQVPNATVVLKVPASATGNTPPVTVAGSASNASVSNIIVTEASAGAVTGSICVTPNNGTTTSFNFTGAPTVSASPTGGTAGVPGAVSIVAGKIQVVITTPSSGSAPTTYTIAAVTVTPTTTVTGPASASVTTGGANCAADTSAVTPNTPIFNVGPSTPSSISGNDADATAAAELEHAFPPGTAICPTTHDVVLATDANFPDALAASYLAQYLATGILLTPTNGISSATTQALRVEGIQTVYVVGGPMAISQTDLNQLSATPAYNCGGTTASGFNLTVSGPIAGQTQYDTAEQIALTPGLGGVGSANLSGAYGSMYNDTTGQSSSAAASTTTAVRTAIVVSGTNFPDASAASVAAYNDQFPVVLTDPTTLSAQAGATLTQLNIKQAIVVGGPLAVSDGDVASIQALNGGITVLRVAGQDQTDTAQELASLELNQNMGTMHLGLNWGTTGANGWANQILVARGDFYSDALAGCLLGHLQGGVSHFVPLLLTLDPNTIGQYLNGFLSAGGSAVGIDGLNQVGGYTGSIQVIQALGGPLALAFTTITAMAQAVAAG
ncbi:MAG TPA: cell wall-binding repeat-containing protein [Acidimicrobiales bacterium]|nr:cell wall-binding repeat-containing protein [Acidimicrobiales bacterium]